MRFTKILLVLALSLPSGALAFPDNGILDDFNRADDTTPPPGSNWTNTTGVSESCNLDVVNNRIAAHTSSSFCASYWNVASYGPAAEAYITIKNTLSGSIHVMASLQQIGAGTTDGYTVQADTGSNSIFIWRIDNSSFTQLGSAIAQSWDPDDAIGIRVEGDQVCAWFNNDGAGWNSIGCRTDSTYSKTGNLGIILSAASGSPGSADDFGGGTAVASGVVCGRRALLGVGC